MDVTCSAGAAAVPGGTTRNTSRTRRVRRWTRVALALCAAGLVLLATQAARNTRDRHPDYALSLAAGAAGTRAPGEFRAGFGRAKITPDVVDTWTDADGNARYEPARGDRYEDRNGNGRFDAFWLAGFQQARPAQGVHDDLWSVAAVLDDGKTRLAIVAIDAIGFMYDDVIDVRRRLPADWHVDHAIICATHCHEVPDLLGLWGEKPYTSGVDSAYLAKVKEGIVASISDAVKALRPARMRLEEIPLSPEGLVRDSRRPEVFDCDVRLMHFQERAGGGTLGTLVTWADHPETAWSGNLQVTADFCGYLRDGVEQGNGQARPGVGGTCLFVNGAIGGLMTTSPGVEVRDPWSGETLKAPGHAKAAAVGHRVADAVLARLAEKPAAADEAPAIQVAAQTVTAPVANVLYRLASAAGVIHRGFTSGEVRTEVNVVRLGPAWIVTVPGELYPEIANGGVESPQGADFGIPPVEAPSIRALMHGRVNFLFGLADDEIGYIVPRSEWDQKAPYTYGRSDAPYGEVNSLGPETAPILYRTLRRMLAR